MKRTNWYIAIFFGMMTLSSCFTEVDVDIPEQFPKLVVGSFINPEDLFITVVVKSSSPIFTTYEDIEIEEVLPNAVVTLSDGVNQINIPYVSGDDYYFIPMTDFPINYGGTYTLEVSAPGYETVTATTSVPVAQPEFLENTVIEVDSVVEQYWSYIDYTMRFKWQDPSQQTNYYRLYVQEVNSGAFINMDKFISDEGEDGEVMSTLGFVQTDMDGSGDAFKAILINASEDYFRYHRSLTNLTYGDPFAEPTIVYSNVKNGLGCFGGYTSKQVVFTP